MTNKEKQKYLDTKKWLESEIEEKDLSGNLDYCKYCDSCMRDSIDQRFICITKQDKRESESICAKAYNKMTRIKKR